MLLRNPGGQASAALPALSERALCMKCAAPASGSASISGAAGVAPLPHAGQRLRHSGIGATAHPWPRVLMHADPVRAAAPPGVRRGAHVACIVPSRCETPQEGARGRARHGLSLAAARCEESAGRTRPPSRAHLSFSPAMEMHSGARVAQIPGTAQSRTRRPPSAALRRTRSVRALRAASMVRRPDTAASDDPVAQDLRRKQHSHLMRYRRAMMKALGAEELLQQLGLGSSTAGGGSGSPGQWASAGPLAAGQHVRSADQVLSAQPLPHAPHPSHALRHVHPLVAGECAAR